MSIVVDSRTPPAGPAEELFSPKDRRVHKEKGYGIGNGYVQIRRDGQSMTHGRLTRLSIPNKC